MNKILRTLKILTQLKGYTENELAKRSSVPQSTLNSLYQNNHMPSLDTLLKLCQGLSIKPSEFFMIYENDYILEEDPYNAYEESMGKNEIIERISHKLLLLSDEDKLLIESIVNKINK